MKDKSTFITVEADSDDAGNKSAQDLTVEMALNDAINFGSNEKPKVVIETIENIE